MQKLDIQGFEIVENLFSGAEMQSIESAIECHDFGEKRHGSEGNWFE